MFTPRTWNISLRTAHIASMGILLGGHAYDIQRDRLLPMLALTIATGAALGVLEAGRSLLWFHQGRGLLTLAKLLLLCVIPFIWAHWAWRMLVLLSVVVLASAGSHAPARIRYYSVIYRMVVPCHGAPGASRLGASEKPGTQSESVGEESAQAEPVR